MNMAGVEAPSLRAYVANAPAARFIWDRAASVRFTDLARGTSLNRQKSWRPACGTGGPFGPGDDREPADDGAGADRARRRRAAPGDPAARYRGRASRRRDGGSRNRCDRDRRRFAAACGVRAPRSRHLRAVDRSARRDAARCRSHRMGTVDLGHDGRAEDGGARSCRAHGGHHQPRYRRRRGDMGTFYDIRRYGGLQIFLRAMLGGASLVLSSAGEPVADHLARLAQHGVTHLRARRRIGAAR